MSKEDDLIRRLSRPTREEICRLMYNKDILNSVDLLFEDAKLILACDWTIDEFVSESGRVHNLPDYKLEEIKEHYYRALKRNVSV